MASEKSLYEHDVGFYYNMPGLGLPGKLISNGYSTWSKRAVDAAINVDLDDSDVLVATYPKTGMRASGLFSVADPREASPCGPQFYQFHAVFFNFGKIVCWRPLLPWRVTPS